MIIIFFKNIFLLDFLFVPRWNFDNFIIFIKAVMEFMNFILNLLFMNYFNFLWVFLFIIDEFFLVNFNIDYYYKEFYYYCRFTIYL